MSIVVSELLLTGIDIIIQGKSNSDGNNNNNTSTVLLVKRKKDPFKDYFALPGGFVDAGILNLDI
ncbi:MAG: NUDIX domain-containing protein [Nitrososphaeraceae archaeon]